MTRVALVDDDRTTNFLNAHLFKKASESFEVSTFSNGKEILEHPTLMDFDFILLDLNMPVMNGIEFITALNAKNETKYPAVVLVIPEISERDFGSIQEQYPFVTGLIHKPLTKENIAKHFTP